MILFTGFKGRNNSSSLLAKQLSSEHLLLTNSFAGLKKDIGSIVKEYDFVVMFGVDTTLTSTVRIEKIASLDGIKLVSSLDLGWIADALNGAGLSAVISDTPTAYLCNAAYYHMLERFSGRAVFMHVPPVRHLAQSFIDIMKSQFVSTLETIPAGAV